MQDFSLLFMLRRMTSLRMRSKTVTSGAVSVRNGLAGCYICRKYNQKFSIMEIVSIEKKTFEEMKERFEKFSEHVKGLCARYRPPERMDWMDSTDVCEKLGVSKRTVQTYRDRGLLPYSQINHKIYYRTEDVEAFLDAMSRETMEEE